MNSVVNDSAEVHTDDPDLFAELAPKLLNLISSALNDRRPAIATAFRWLKVLQSGLGHKPYLVRAMRHGELVGVLPLAFVNSWLFGRFLVSLPYVNSAGATASDRDVSARLISSAVDLADKLNVRYLEIRSEQEMDHPALEQKSNAKVLMRRSLPGTPDGLWNSFKSKLRSQIRAGQRNDFEVSFGREDQLKAFYAVFSENMRDLGTPVYSLSLFSSILGAFGENSELCVLRLKGRPVAAALLVHGESSSEVPSASALRAYNSTNANMVLYWHLLERATRRGMATFDFGRSSLDSNTYKFKAQWGAEPHPSVWQYHVRKGSANEMRPDHAKYGLAIQAWKRMPLWMTRLIGPSIVRGIP